jgi:hypothetical protein
LPQETKLDGDLLFFFTGGAVHEVSTGNQKTCLLGGSIAKKAPIDQVEDDGKDNESHLMAV